MNDTHSNNTPDKYHSQGTFIADTTFSNAAKSFIACAIRILKFIIRRRPYKRRYIVLSPSVSSKQIIYDRSNKTVTKVSIRDHSDYGIVNQIYLAEDYSIERLRRKDEIKNFYLSIFETQKTPLIIDCGGNIGLAAKYFSENYSKAKILCIEPDAANVLQARKNNASENVIILEKAIGPEKSRGAIIDPGLGYNGYRVEEKTDGNIEIISINELLTQYDPRRFVPFIVKIDIEGFEQELFSKNVEWIQKFPLLIIELHDWMLPRSQSANNFIKAIAPLNRDFIYIGENVFSISNTLL